MYINTKADLAQQILKIGILLIIINDIEAKKALLICHTVTLLQLLNGLELGKLNITNYTFYPGKGFLMTVLVRSNRI